MLTPRNFPIRGIQFYDGPVNIQSCTFRKFAALEGRHTSALAFRLNNAWQSCPHNNVTDITFEDVPVSGATGWLVCGSPDSRVSQQPPEELLLALAQLPGTQLEKYERKLPRSSLGAIRTLIPSGHMNPRHPGTGWEATPACPCSGTHCLVWPPGLAP